MQSTSSAAAARRAAASSSASRSRARPSSSRCASSAHRQPPRLTEQPQRVAPGAIVVSDVVGAFNFTVRLIETAKPASRAHRRRSRRPSRAGFSECSGLEATHGDRRVARGRPQRRRAALPRPGHATRTCSCGAASPSATSLWKWHESFLQGRGKRRDGVIELLDDGGTTVRTWRFRRGLPVRWAGPALARGDQRVAIEELEIVHEGLFVQAGGAFGDALNTVASIFGGS